MIGYYWQARKARQAILAVLTDQLAHRWLHAWQYYRLRQKEQLDTREGPGDNKALCLGLLLLWAEHAVRQCSACHCCLGSEPVLHTHRTWPDTAYCQENGSQGWRRLSGCFRPWTGRQVINNSALKKLLAAKSSGSWQTELKMGGQCPRTGEANAVTGDGANGCPLPPVLWYQKQKATELISTHESADDFNRMIILFLLLMLPEEGHGL